MCEVRKLWYNIWTITMYIHLGTNSLLPLIHNHREREGKEGRKEGRGVGRERGREKRGGREGETRVYM